MSVGAVQDGAASSGIGRWFPDVVDALSATGRAVPAFELIVEDDAWASLSLAQMRSLLAALREQGFLRRAATVAQLIDERSADPDTRASALVRAELSVLQGEVELPQDARQRQYSPITGRVMQVASASALDGESNATGRTRAIAGLGTRLGVEMSVVTQMGIAERTTYDVDDLDGVAHHRIPGPKRGSRPFDEWMRLHVARLAAVVRKVRPSVLVASSDFVNGIAALVVGREYGIPVVYDLRGLYEDAWLRRQREKHAWSEDQVPGAWGYPDVWMLRRERELEVARGANVVVAATTALRDWLVESGVEPEAVRLSEEPSADEAVWAHVLEEVGAVDRGSAELARVELRVDDVVAAIAQGERRPLGMVETFAGSGTVDSVRDIGWRHAGMEPVLITVPFDWIRACRDHRSQGFHLHAWDFMVPFLKAWNRDRDRDALEWCLERAADWAGTFTDVADHGTMAWYDMSIGLRAPRLAYLLQEAIHERAPSRVVERLTNAVRVHQRALFAPQAFNSSTNHGFYTAVGQLSFTKRLAPLPGMATLDAQGHQRLKVVVATQFAEDGGHLEHSPDYHRMLLSSFINAMEDGLLTDPEVSARIERASEVMGWFLRPDRTVVQIGDSPARAALRSDREMAAPHTLFLVREGAQGEPNPEELLVLDQSGYAIVRSPQPRSTDDHLNAGYLTLMAGFHSRTHKHCDDLSVTWFDAGEELLIDAGRFGYLEQLPADSPQRELGFFYGRPERQYVERTLAHNTVEADGRDHERRRRAPYGSGIEQAEQLDGRFRLVGAVDHGTWSHRRTIHFAPGQWLLVEDDVRSSDDRPHDFRVWWNLPEELSNPTVESSEVRFALASGRSLQIESLDGAQLVEPVLGQQSPLRGWRSRVDYEFAPAWSLAHHVESTTDHVFRTLLSIDGSRPADADIR